MVFPLGHAVIVHVHAVDVPVGGFDDALGQVVADEAVHAQDQYFFIEISFIVPLGTLICISVSRGEGRRGPVSVVSIQRQRFRQLFQRRAVQRGG